MNWGGDYSYCKGALFSCACREHRVTRSLVKSFLSERSWRQLDLQDIKHARLPDQARIHLSRLQVVHLFLNHSQELGSYGHDLGMMTVREGIVCPKTTMVTPQEVRVDAAIVYFFIERIGKNGTEGIFSMEIIFSLFSRLTLARVWQYIFWGKNSSLGKNSTITFQHIEIQVVRGN